MKFIYCIILGSLLCSPAYASKLYKWVDEDGNIQYSQTPPPEQAIRQNIAEKAVPQDNTIATRPVAGTETTDTEDQDTDANAEGEETDPAAKLKAEKERNCNKAQEQHSRLSSEEKILIADPNQEGSYVALSGEARAAKRAEMQAYMNTYCQPAN